MSENRRTIIAAAVIFAGFVLVAYFLPDIMRAAGEISPWAAGLVVAAFLLSIFVLFWLRSRYKGR